MVRTASAEYFRALSRSRRIRPRGGKMHRVHLLPLLSCAAALQAPWFVKTETFKQSLSFPQIRPHLEAHKAWVAGLRADGHSITSGYRVDAEGAPGGGGLMLFPAEDYAAAEQLVLCDPLVANGCVDWQLNQWVADVGDIALVDGGAWPSPISLVKAGVPSARAQLAVSRVPTPYRARGSRA